MHDSITIKHYLTSFDVTQEPISHTTSAGHKVVLLNGKMTTPVPRICPRCGSPMDVYQKSKTTLQHMPLFTKPLLVIIERLRTRCRRCRLTQTQEIPFKSAGHRLTKHLETIVNRHTAAGMTLKEVSELYMIHPSIVKAIDRRRLAKTYTADRPKRYSTHIAIDEFLLHKGHRYATVVIDLDTGEILFCEAGKKKEQVFHFIQQMGRDWMRHLKAVSMDMNAQYDSAFRQWAPHVKIVYDLFHVVKLYNDKVLTTMRRRKQRELLE